MDNFLKSHFKDVRIPDNVTLPEYMLGRFKDYGDKVAMVRKSSRLYYNTLKRLWFCIAALS